MMIDRIINIQVNQELIERGEREGGMTNEWPLPSMFMTMPGPARVEPSQAGLHLCNFEKQTTKARSTKIEHKTWEVGHSKR